MVVAGTLVFASMCLAQTSSASQQSPRDSVAVVPVPPTTDSSLRTGPAPDALIYSVDRIPESVFQTARAVSVVSGSELRRRGARTLPEALMEEVGVFVQQTAYGHGAPIIRGMIGKQILILVNGVRLNNATFRLGPNQYLSTIDLEAVERVEIVRGVGSVLGSDALGGIINVITKTGPAEGSSAGIAGRVSTRLSSADGSRSLHGEVLGRASALRFIGGGTYRRTGDVRAGGDVGRQNATGYEELSGNLNVERSFGQRFLSASVNVMEQREVPRTDRVASGTHLRYNYDPQRMQLATIRFEDQTAHGWADAIQLTAFYNRQDEDQEEVFAATPGTERRFTDSDLLIGGNAEAAVFLGAHRLVYGADYSTERIHSRQTDVDLATDIGTARRGIYTDGATYQTAAIYLQDRFDLSRWLTPTLGLRYSGFRSTGAEATSVGTLNLDGTKSALTASAALVVHARDWLNLMANVTSGFRAPNLDDISAFEVRDEGTEVPNPDARSEHIDNYEIGTKIQTARLTGSAFYFTSSLSDLLVHTAGSFRGLDYFDTNGNGQRDANERSVVQKRNVGSARVIGGEAAFRYLLLPSLRIAGNATYTRGDDIGENIPLGMTPPVFGGASARWQSSHSSQRWAEVAYAFAGSQRRLSVEDVSDTRIGPLGTDGWATVALRGGAMATRHLSISAALENLLNEKYKYHGSGVYRPGRQLVLHAEYTF